MALSLYGLISDSERAFIIGGVNEDLRSDGRSCSDFRSIEMDRVGKSANFLNYDRF